MFYVSITLNSAQDKQTTKQVERKEHIKGNLPFLCDARLRFYKSFLYTDVDEWGQTHWLNVQSVFYDYSSSCGESANFHPKTPVPFFLPINFYIIWSLLLFCSSPSLSSIHGSVRCPVWVHLDREGRSRTTRGPPKTLSPFTPGFFEVFSCVWEPGRGNCQANGESLLRCWDNLISRASMV